MLPAGRFLSGTIRLKSNVTFFLDNNATLIGTEDVKQYRGAAIKPEDPKRPINIPKDASTWTRALVLLDSVNNVTITGNGTIDGSFLSYAPGRRGPHGIMIISSNNIKISNIRVTRAGDWSIVGFYVDSFTVTNVTVADGYDGIHVRGGKNILIENCKLYARDDAIAGGYWENTLITDCLINSSCNGIRLVLPATNLEIKSCAIIGPGVFGHRRGPADNPWITNTLTGIILQPGAWGLGPGKLEKIHIHDITIKNVQTALTFVLNEGNTAKDVLVENVTATGISHNACSVEAWPADSKYENITFKNVAVSYEIVDPAVLRVKSFDRPRTESRPLPYWGFYLRNVKNIEFENVRLDYQGAEERSAMGFDNVESVRLNNVRYRQVQGIQPLKYPAGTKVKITNSAAFR